MTTVSTPASRLECDLRVVKKRFMVMKGGSGLIAFAVLAEDLGLTASTHAALNVPGELTLPSELLDGIQTHTEANTWTLTFLGTVMMIGSHFLS